MELKESFLPEREIIINKTIKIKDTEVHLISITLEEGKSSLWVLCKMSCNSNEEAQRDYKKEYKSNRDEIIDDLKNEKNNKTIDISEMNIQKQKMTFRFSGGINIFYCEGAKECCELQHFREKNIFPIDFDDSNLENMFLEKYEQEENEEFPEIDLSKNLDITLKTESYTECRLIDKLQPIQLKLGEIEKGKQLYFYDSVEKKKHIFYIDRLYSYDCWKEENDYYNNKDFTKNFSKEELDEMKKRNAAHLEEVVPKGMNLAILEYETEDDIQLEFYSKKYLDSEPIHKGSVVDMMFMFPSKIGINGFKTRTCEITPIEKDFDDVIDIELVSYYIEVPEEIIEV